MSDQATRAGQEALLPDHVYLRALEVGRGAAGVSGPNPPVGCLLLRDGEVVGEGRTAAVGGPHAEAVALAAAGRRAQGSIAVVTLEPCAHRGRTAPCAHALVDAGVREVHLLAHDPDPIAAGGVAVLRAAGVTVIDVGARRPHLAEAASHDLRGFLARVRDGRPHVTLKLAQSTDGATVPTTGRYLTGAVARRRVHAVRAESDAVLVGGATVRQDDPALDVRHVDAARDPRPVVLSVAGAIGASARVVREGAILVHGPGASGAALEPIAARGVVLVEAPLQPPAGGLDLREVLARLLAERILTVLAEPGVRLASALLAEDLVDVIELHVAGGASCARGEIRSALPELAGLLDGTDSATVTETSDGDLILRAVPHHRSARHAALEGAA